MKNHYRSIITVFVTVILSVAVLPGQKVFAEIDRFLSRGEVVAKVVDEFDLQNKHQNFIASCWAHLDECFFVFSAMSDFDGIRFEPMILYPDVSVAYRYYDQVVIATMLGLVHGYIDEDQSPFYPRALMTRMEALKVVLGAAGLMDWQERFQLMATFGEDGLRAQKTIFSDVNLENAAVWWYPRYLNFALEKGIIKAESRFRPDEFVTKEELDDMMERALKSL